MNENNDVLTAVALVEKLVPMLKADKRDQVNRTTLETCNRILAQAMNKLTRFNSSLGNISLYLIGSYDLIQEMLSDTEFDMTDTTTKEVLSNNCKAALDELYLFAGKHYFKDNGFEYSMGIDSLLQRIIDSCIAQGFYFGYGI